MGWVLGRVGSVDAYRLLAGYCMVMNDSLRTALVYIIEPASTSFVQERINEKKGKGKGKKKKKPEAVLMAILYCE